MSNATPKPNEVLLMGIAPPLQEAFPTHLVYSNADRIFTPPECAAIISVGESKGFSSGRIGNIKDGESSVDESYRCVEVCNLTPTDVDATGQDIKWAFAKVAQRVSWANQKYGFHLSGFAEPWQLLKYTAPEDGRPAGHYKQHQDFGGGSSSIRKLSCVIQLSHITDYEGCRLHLQTNIDHEVPEVCQGDMIIFPSWTPHYVTPIQTGVRYAIAVWVGGPRFV